jgi:preprotein translocase subunit SecB
MIPSALQAESTVLTRLEIRLADGAPPTTPPQVQLGVRTGFTNLDLPRRWRLDLEVTIGAAEGEPQPPYSIVIALSGVFRVPDEIEMEAARKLAFVNGLSILYSSARETVLLLTGRFPLGPFVLPAVSFVDEYDRLAPQQVAESPALYGEKK